MMKGKKVLLTAAVLFGSGVVSAAAVQAYPNCGYKYLGEGCVPEEVQEAAVPAQPEPVVAQPVEVAEPVAVAPAVEPTVDTGATCSPVDVPANANVQIPATGKPCRVEVKEGPRPPQLNTILKKYERTVETWGEYKQKDPQYLLSMIRNLIQNFPAPKEAILNAPANCCYGMLVRPPIYKEVVIEYVKHDPKYKIQVTKPEFQKVIKEIKVLVRPEYTEKVCEDAKYEPRQEKIQVAPPSFKLVEKNGVICKVQTPPKEVTITRYVMVEPPKCKTIYHAPVYATVKVPVYKLVKPATCDCQPGEPQIDKIVDRFMVEGPKVIWDAVLCDVNLRPDEIKLIQQKLAELGYYHGPINGVLDEATMMAVVKFQVDHDLPAGNISIETLEALGLHELAKNYTMCKLHNPVSQ